MDRIRSCAHAIAKIKIITKFPHIRTSKEMMRAIEVMFFQESMNLL